ncbi:MAG: metallophosphatase family protein [Prevotellaceae bacterium]|nr:metallophosphatase family protein [Prevotellaceae bacterium]
MITVGLLSDTHAYWDDRYAEYFAPCEEIWHAGDIGSLEVAQRLGEIATLRAVHGNVDGANIRLLYPDVLRWECEGVDVLMTHIGGYPGRYAPQIRDILYRKPPRLFICGHSHILKVQYDKTLQLLHINPGAAGLQGWQQVRTLVRFRLDKGNISDLEVIELKRSFD